jgi:hypothetical protein
MLQNTENTSVIGHSANAAQLATTELASSNLSDDSVVFVSDGEWEDPRKDVTGKYVEDHGERTNAVGKLQRSITIVLPDGSTMLVSAFDAKAKKLEGLKLGYTYSFRGKLKTKTETFLGKAKTSRFLNL